MKWTERERESNTISFVAADLLANGSRSRPSVGDHQVASPGYLPSHNGFDIFQTQQSGVVPRGVTPVPGASLQRGPSSPLVPDVSIVFSVDPFSIH